MYERTPAQILKWTQDVSDILSQPDLLVFWAHAQGVSVAHARRILLQSLAKGSPSINEHSTGPNSIVAEDKAQFAARHRVRLQYGMSGSSRSSGKLYSDSANSSTMSLGNNLGEVGSSSSNNSDSGSISRR